MILPYQDVRLSDSGSSSCLACGTSVTLFKFSPLALACLVCGASVALGWLSGFKFCHPIVRSLLLIKSHLAAGLKVTMKRSRVTMRASSIHCSLPTLFLTMMRPMVLSLLSFSSSVVTCRCVSALHTRASCRPRTLPSCLNTVQTQSEVENNNH